MGACVAGGRAIKRVSGTQKIEKCMQLFWRLPALLPSGCPFLTACLPWNFLCILTCETAKFFQLTAQRPPQADSIDSHVNYILTHTHTWTPIYKLRVRWPGQSGTCTLSQWHNLCAQYEFRCIGWCIKWGRISGKRWREKVKESGRQREKGNSLWSCQILEYSLKGIFNLHATQVRQWSQDIFGISQKFHSLLQRFYETKWVAKTHQLFLWGNMNFYLLTKAEQ